MPVAPAVRRILCPTDFSELSERALSQAVALARRWAAEIVVAHVDRPALLPRPGIADLTAPAPDPRTFARRVSPLRRFSETVRAAGVPVRALRLAGDPGREIVAQARALSADLIVMATHGRAGLERWVLGSVTEKVLGRAPCPVLTVSAAAGAPPNAVGASFKRIVCALDLGPFSSTTLESAVSLALESEAELTVLHVVEGPSRGQLDFNTHFDVPEHRGHMLAEARKELRAAVPEDVRAKLGVREIVVEGSIAEEIRRVATEQAAELVVIGAHGRNPIDVLFSGATVRNVVRRASCPVLAVRPRSAAPRQASHVRAVAVP